MISLSNNLLRLSIATSLITLSACATVTPSPGSEDVRLLTPDDAKSCTKIGNASAQVLDEILFVDRGYETMADELLALAKNEAVKMSGNAVLPISEIKDGSRDYQVFKCN